MRILILFIVGAFIFSTASAQDGSAPPAPEPAGTTIAEPVPASTASPAPPATTNPPEAASSPTTFTEVSSGISAPTPEETSRGAVNYIPIALAIFAAGLGTAIISRLGKKNKQKKNEDKKCLNWKKLMEEKLNELTDIKSQLGDYAKEKTLEELKRETQGTRAGELLARAERAEKEYRRFKELYEKCIAGLGKKYIDKLAFIEIKDRKVLITQSGGKDIWYIPGGKRDSGESDEQALVREVKEELNIDIDPSTIKRYGTFEAQAHGKPAGTMVRMTCYQAKYSGQLTPSAEIEKLDWFDYSKKESTSPVDHLIFDDLKKKNLID